MVVVQRSSLLLVERWTGPWQLCVKMVALHEDDMVIDKVNR